MELTKYRTQTDTQTPHAVESCVKIPEGPKPVSCKARYNMAHVCVI